jgi:hypothetical protein
MLYSVGLCSTNKVEVIDPFVCLIIVSVNIEAYHNVSLEFT